MGFYFKDGKCISGIPEKCPYGTIKVEIGCVPLAQRCERIEGKYVWQNYLKHNK